MRFAYLWILILGVFGQKLFGAESPSRSSLLLEALSTPLTHQRLDRIPVECVEPLRDFFEIAMPLVRRIMNRQTFENQETKYQLLKDISDLIISPGINYFFESIAPIRPEERMHSNLSKWDRTLSILQNYLKDKKKLSPQTQKIEFFDPINSFNLNDLYHPLVWETFRFKTTLDFIYYIWGNNCKLFSEDTDRELIPPLPDWPCGRYILEPQGEFYFFINTSIDSCDAVRADFMRILLDYSEKTEAIEAIRSYLKSKKIADMLADHEAYERSFKKQMDFMGYLMPFFRGKMPGEYMIETMILYSLVETEKKQKIFWVLF